MPKKSDAYRTEWQGKGIVEIIVESVSEVYPPWDSQKRL